MSPVKERVSELIRAAQNGDSWASDALIRENSPLIWSVVRRFFGRGIEADDLFQLGSIGFIKAVRDFDESYGNCFSTYAVPKIAGEIKRFLRDDGIIKVSRDLKGDAIRINSARKRLVDTLGREPHLSELSAECKIAPEDIAKCEIAVMQPSSLNKSLSEDGMTMEDILGTECPEEDILEKLMLHDAIRALPDIEHKVIYLRFFKGMTQENSARVLNISQVQVSRIEKKAINRLRAKVTE